MQVKSIAPKLPFVVKIFVLSILEWPFYTGFTVHTSDHMQYRYWVSSVKKGQPLGGISLKLQRNDKIWLKISIPCRILVVKNYLGDLKLFSRNSPW